MSQKFCCIPIIIPKVGKGKGRRLEKLVHGDTILEEAGSRCYSNYLEEPVAPVAQRYLVTL